MSLKFLWKFIDIPLFVYISPRPSNLLLILLLARLMKLSLLRACAPADQSVALMLSLRPRLKPTLFLV